jgi:nucleoside-diphosphate-sugar epimerase
MKYEICGKGFLGGAAFDYFRSRHFPAPFFSSKEFQYAKSSPIDERNCPDIFLNVSGPSSIEKSFMMPELYLTSPLNQVKFQLENLSLLNKPPHYVYVSSASVYGECLGLIPSEDSEFNPISPYASGKVEVEQFLLSKKMDYTGGITVIRATSVFSESLSSRVLGRIRNQATSRKDIVLFGDGSEIRDFIHTDFFFRALHEIVVFNISTKRSDVFNLGSGFPISILELTNLAISSAEGPQAQTIIFNGGKRLGDPHSMIVSIDKINKILPWKMPNQTFKLKEYFSFRQSVFDD